MLVNKRHKKFRIYQEDVKFWFKNLKIGIQKYGIWDSKNKNLI